MAGRTFNSDRLAQTCKSLPTKTYGNLPMTRAAQTQSGTASIKGVLPKDMNSRRPTDPRAVLLVKILRHDHYKHNLTMYGHLYIKLDDILGLPIAKKAGIERKDIPEIVNLDEKARFAVTYESESPHDWFTGSTVVDSKHCAQDIVFIRANQGHSNVTYEFPDINILDLSRRFIHRGTYIFHGTQWRHWTNIRKSGYLDRMKRTHIHFAKSLPISLVRSWVFDNAIYPRRMWRVLPDNDHRLSGLRSSCTIALVVDLKKYLTKYGNNGLKWGESMNGVVLCSGSHQGLEGEGLPIRFIEGIIDISTGSFTKLDEEVIDYETNQYKDSILGRSLSKRERNSEH